MSRITRCPICDSVIEGHTIQPFSYAEIELHPDGGADLHESTDASGSETEIYCENRHTTEQMAKALPA